MRLAVPALFLVLTACAVSPITPSGTPVPVTAPMPITVGKTSAVPAPGSGAVTRTTVYQTNRTVAQVLRLAPGSVIALHHHPFYDESFVVTQGAITLNLNGSDYLVNSGEFIVMPAGTIITGHNSGSIEAAAVVTFSSTGVAGALSVPGASSH
jgi:quercetin dioxygenase-like cupin family protein